MRPASRTDNYHVFVLFVRGEAAMPTNSNQNISAGAGTIPYKAPYPTRPQKCFLLAINQHQQVLLYPYWCILIELTKSSRFRLL